MFESHPCVDRLHSPWGPLKKFSYTGLSELATHY